MKFALHELSRKELVRQARTTSMEGESEYSFWHLLVRDVAYSQIPRAERARRHRAAAEWIERKAGERVEDLAEVLAHHYLQALEFSQAAGDLAQAEELAAPARRFLALAGERALGLDTAQAEARLTRALELTPLEDPERWQLGIRWADAAFQAGRPLEAANALDDTLASLQARGETEATAQALQLRSRISLRLGEGRHLAFAADAVRLLERQAPGRALVDAHAQLANAQCIAGAYREAIAAAERARELAETLGIPEPARALAYHGFARAFLGDADGLPEMERALTLLEEQGAGRDVAILQNNLAIARYPLQGPAGSLADFEAGIAFCEQRGLAESALHLDCSCPGLLTELGRPDEAIERAARLARELEEKGITQTLCEVRSVEFTTRIERGQPVRLEDAEWLIEVGRATSAVDMTALALASAAVALATECPARALALLNELEQAAGAHETPYYARQLPTMVQDGARRRRLEGRRPPGPRVRASLPARRARPLRRARATRRARGRARGGCGALRRGSVALAGVRKRAGARVRAPRAGSLSSCPRSRQGRRGDPRGA